MEPVRTTGLDLRLNFVQIYCPLLPKMVQSQISNMDFILRDRTTTVTAVSHKTKESFWSELGQNVSRLHCVNCAGSELTELVLFTIRKASMWNRSFPQNEGIQLIWALSQCSLMVLCELCRYRTNRVRSIWTVRALCDLRWFFVGLVISAWSVLVFCHPYWLCKIWTGIAWSARVVTDLS